MGAAANSAVTELTSGLSATMPPAQQVAYDDLMAASQQLMPFTAALSVVNVLVSIGLIAGGIMCLAVRKPVSRLVLMGALMGCVLHDVLKAILTALNTYLMQDAMAAYTKAMAGGMPPGSPDMEAIMGASQGIGLIIAFVFIVAFLVFYAFGLVVLKGWTPVEEG